MQTTRTSLSDHCVADPDRLRAGVLDRSQISWPRFLDHASHPDDAFARGGGQLLGFSLPPQIGLFNYPFFLTVYHPLHSDAGLGAARAWQSSSLTPGCGRRTDADLPRRRLIPITYMRPPRSTGVEVAPVLVITLPMVLPFVMLAYFSRHRKLQMFDNGQPADLGGPGSATSCVDHAEARGVEKWRTGYSSRSRSSCSSPCSAWPTSTSSPQPREEPMRPNASRQEHSHSSSSRARARALPPARWSRCTR